jgi:hypothetical protein
MGTGGPFPGGKALSGRDADHSPPSSAEVVSEEVYLSPQAPAWRVVGMLYFSSSGNVYWPQVGVSRSHCQLYDVGNLHVN